MGLEPTIPWTTTTCLNHLATVTAESRGIEPRTLTQGPPGVRNRLRTIPWYFPRERANGIEPISLGWKPKAQPHIPCSQTAEESGFEPGVTPDPVFKTGAPPRCLPLQLAILDMGQHGLLPLPKISNVWVTATLTRLRKHEESNPEDLSALASLSKRARIRCGDASLSTRST
jgi:hypothetical protein